MSIEEAREKIAELFRIARAEGALTKYEDGFSDADDVLDLPLVSGLSIRQLCETGDEGMLTFNEMKAAMWKMADEYEAEGGEIDHITQVMRFNWIARAQLLKCNLHQAAHDAQIRRDTAKEIFGELDNQLIYNSMDMGIDVIHNDDYQALRDKYLKGETK